MEAILIVDDDTETLRLAKEILETGGLTVRCAASGEEALLVLQGNAFSLMITDLTMPGMDGFALGRRVAVIAPFMPIVMMTGDIAPEIPRLAEEAGIRAVLSKPFLPEQILEAVEEVLGKRRKEGAF
jgi:two-component system capsular synthesis sensor histidine kinase RcsC